MRRRHHWKAVVAVTVVLVFAGSAWAEYCSTQGTPRIPKGEVWRFDWRAFLSVDEIIASEAKHLPWGTPADCSHLLFHKEYVLCYDFDRKGPSWASYRLERRDVKEGERWNAFRSDPRLPEDRNPACADYQGSGFDRGHLVPRSDMNRLKTAIVNSFFLTNMGPQFPNMNQGVWERLERLVRAWAKTSGWVHVISGSVYDHDNDGQPDALAQIPRTPSGHVAVPSHFFKVVIREPAPGTLEAITVLVPNLANVPGRTSTDAARDAFLRQRIISAGEIRQRTGRDHLPMLSVSQKAQLEAEIASDLWPVN
jgi:DNA/RNA endonuclease G (NUC1)